MHSSHPSFQDRFETQVSIRAAPADCRTLASKIAFFKAKIRLLPQISGVYKMLDATGKIIYIGKAKNLRHRVASYFHARHDRLVTQLLVTRIQALDYVVTITEKDALILENILIKRHQPFFNIDLKDKKTYPYLWLTTHEKFPRLVKTRELTGKGTYFGPYTDVKKINVYLDVINSLYTLKKCRQTRFPQGFKPCLYYHIGKCLDYCTGNVPQQTIQALNLEIKGLLKGNLQEVIVSLELKIKEASEALNYELALTIRNACTTLKALDSEQTISTLKDDSFDVFHYNVSAGWLIVSLLMFREGRLVDKEIFQFKNALWGSIEDSERISQQNAKGNSTEAPNQASMKHAEQVSDRSSKNNAEQFSNQSSRKHAEQVFKENSTEAPKSRPQAESLGAGENLREAENPFATAETLQFIVEAFSQFFFEYYQQNNDPIAYIVLPEDLLGAQGARVLLMETIREAMALSQARSAQENQGVRLVEGKNHDTSPVLSESSESSESSKSSELSKLPKSSPVKSPSKLSQSSQSPELSTQAPSSDVIFTRGRNQGSVPEVRPSNAPDKVGDTPDKLRKSSQSSSQLSSQLAQTSKKAEVTKDKAKIKPPHLITGLKGDKKRFLRLAKANADQSFYNRLYHHKKQEYLKRLKEVLNLDKIPSVIDAFDVANTGDQSLVAACVRFIDGNPDKQQYRLFNIRSTRQQNDFLSMAEAVYRRYRRLRAEKSGVLPQLILIDGGRGQLNVAHKSLAKLDLGKISLISLAKQEELIFTRAAEEPIRLPQTDEALRYLVRVRDEVHRFVNKHHTHRRDKAMLESSFTKIPGLGPKKINTLLTHFDSLEVLKLSSREYVTSLPYIGNKDYDLLVAFFKHQPLAQSPLLSSRHALQHVPQHSSSLSAQSLVSSSTSYANEDLVIDE